METTDIKQFSNTREQRAKLILEKGSPETLDEFTYLVPSEFSDKKYKAFISTKSTIPVKFSSAPIGL